MSSPCGTYVASLSRSQDHIYVQWTDSLFPAFTFTLQSTAPSAAQTQSGTSERKTLQWTPDSTHLLLITPREVRLFSLADTAIKRHVSNGTGGLGNIIAAEVLGEHLVVAWEFGNLQQWNISSGRGSECGHVRIDETGRPMWALRDATPNVFVTLSMVQGLEVLAFRLVAQPLPFKTLNVRSQDTKSLAWSKDGRWLATLDSSLAAQSVHVYTADGHLFRSYPQIDRGSDTSSVPQTGFTSMRWSKSCLYLVSPRRPITCLDAQTLSQKHIFAVTPSSAQDLSAWREEHSTDNNFLSFRFVTAPAIPATSISAEGSDIEINANGTLFATWNTERSAQSLTIWDVRIQVPCALLMLQSRIRSVSWHPTRWDNVLVVCQDGSLRIWSLSSAEAPLFLACPVPSTTEVTRVKADWAVGDQPTQAAQQAQSPNDAILVTDRKTGWSLVWPHGRPPTKTPVLPSLPEDTQVSGQQDVTEQDDSLCDILSGKKPLPSLLDRARDPDETTNVVVEDTFELVKHRPPVRVSTGTSEMF